MWLRKRKPCKRGYEFKLLDQSQDAANGGDDDPLGMAAHAVLSSFKDSTTGSLLVQSHTEIREANAAADESPGSLLLDLLVLLALSERADFAMPQTRLCIHGWRPTSSPLTDYKPIAYHLQYTTIWTASVFALLAPSLLRLSIFVSLAPARGTLASASEDGLESPIQAFILDLHHRFNRKLEGELINSLLHISKEVATGD